MILGGRERLIREVAIERGINKWTLRMRLQIGWTPEEAAGLVERINPAKEMVSYRGDQIPVEELAMRHGLTNICLRKRLASGMDVETAIEKPLEKRGGKAAQQEVEVAGEMGTIKHFAEKHHQNPKAVYARIKLGWSLGEALGIKKRESGRGIYQRFNYATNDVK